MSIEYIVLATNETELADAIRTVNSLSKYCNIRIAVSTQNLMKGHDYVLLPWSDVPPRFDTFEGHLWKTAYIGDNDVVVFRPGIQTCRAVIDFSTTPRVSTHIGEWIAFFPNDIHGYDVVHTMKDILDEYSEIECPDITNLFKIVSCECISVLSLSYVEVAVCTNPVVEIQCGGVTYGMSGSVLVDGMYVDSR